MTSVNLPEVVVALNRRHHQRLREIYRSSGWPCQDMLEVELLASGLLERITSMGGHETLRVTDAGVVQLAQAFAHNKAARSSHEALVEKVAVEMGRAGRLVWRGLSLRAQVPAPDSGAADALAWMSSRFATPRLKPTWSPSSTKSRSAVPICWATSKNRPSGLPTWAWEGSVGMCWAKPQKASPSRSRKKFRPSAVSCNAMATACWWHARRRAGRLRNCPFMSG
jgi:hypothetical protein